MLRAILFDCDGVIADTEPVHFELFRQVLAVEGIEMPEKEYYAVYVGMTDKECFEAVFEKNRKPLDEAKLVSIMRKKHELFTKVLPQKLVGYSATLGLIEEARGKVEMGVVSGALREEIELILMSLNISDAFKTIISAEDVPHGKPDPGGYLLGLQRLSVKASEAVGIEDTPAGIQAIKGAGMRAIGIANIFNKVQLARADLVFEKGQKISLESLTN